VHTPLAGLSLQPLLCCQRRNRLLWASLRRCQPGQWARRAGEVLFVSRVPVPRVWLKPRWRVSGLWFALSAEAGASRPPPHCESPVLTPFAMSWASTAPRHTPYVSYHIQCLAAGPQLNRLWLADLSLQPCCQRRNRLPWASLRHCWLGQWARRAGKVHLGFRVIISYPMPGRRSTAGWPTCHCSRVARGGIGSRGLPSDIVGWGNGPGEPAKCI